MDTTKKISLTALAGGLALALTLGGAPAGAGTAQGPEIRDPAGDANFVNGQGFFSGLERVGGPASIDSADIRAIWFETAHDPVPETDDFGNVTVTYEPTALLVRIRTVAPASPPPTPAVMYRVQASIAGCEVWFQALLSNGQPLVSQQANIRKLSGCPGGSGTISSSEFGLTFEENVMTLRYPLSAFPYSSDQIVLAEDVEIRPSGGRPHVREFSTAFLTFPVIDETVPLATKFRIGSDAPAPVDCSANPDHPDCQA